MYSVDKFAYRDDISVPAEVVCVFLLTSAPSAETLVYQCTNTRTDTLGNVACRVLKYDSETDVHRESDEM